MSSIRGHIHFVLVLIVSDHSTVDMVDDSLVISKVALSLCSENVVGIVKMYNDNWNLEKEQKRQANERDFF